MLPGRRRHHGRARTALAILLAALPVLPLPLAAASAVAEAAASPWHETASRSGHASASALAAVHNAVGGASRPAHYDPLHAEEWFVRQRAYPLTAIPAGARLRALAQLAAL